MLRRFVCLSLLLSLAGFISAQTTSPTSVIKDASAVALAQKALAAMGGAALKGYQDSTVAGTMTYYSDTGTQAVPAVLKSKGTTQVRQEFQRGTSTDTYISNGSAACMNSAKSGKTAMYSVDLTAQRIDHIPALSLLSEYANSDMNVQYAGTATVNGSLADVIALSFAITALPAGYDSLKLTQHLFYVDRATGFVTKVQFVRNGNGAPGVNAKIEMYFSNYQNVAGIAVPFKRSVYVEGKLASDLSLTSVNLNAGLLDSDFAPACGGGQ